MRVAAVLRDLMFGSRIFHAASHAGVEFVRVDSPADLPPADELDVVLVDWSDRTPEWGMDLKAWYRLAPGPRRPRLILFGPHGDLTAHYEAKHLGLGPMVARSKLAADLDSLLSP